MTDHHPFINGIAVQINGNIQAAIRLADQRYQQKYHRTPTHVSLPVGADVALYGGTLNFAYHSGPGLVIVGCALDDQELV